ncbi:tetratricopeptide repeat protein [Aurantiacibacter aquimixticola]|nr:tetratricopeptide repeat protein [Aurantiacibacter aquimixticola]
MKAGNVVEAETLFAEAARLAPGNPDFAINHAIALSWLDRHREAIAVLEGHRTAGERDPRYCSARANSARQLRDLAEAARWYDRSLALAPQSPRPLHGRARVALERGEADAARRFEAAIAANRADGEAWLGLVEALSASGETQRARELAERLVSQMPNWVAALRVLAQIRLGAGDADFASHVADAARQKPDDPAIPRAHVEVLEGHDRFEDALTVATDASETFPHEPYFRLMAGTLAGYLEDAEAAAAHFEAVDPDLPDGWLMEARFRLQTGEYDRAAALLDRLIEKRPNDIAAWSTRDLLWRLTDNERAQWLHGQDGMVRMVALPDAYAVLAQVRPTLHALHDASAFPLGQSLRGGTQTRGGLFERMEPELARLHEAILDALADYRSGLPEKDDSHPLLSRQDSDWTIAGSWSVRLCGGGDFHAAHLHPQGIISSALYCELPDDMGNSGAAERTGWIELGRPPPKMHLDLGPLHVLEPKVGHLALFPSTLYHGTLPFTEGRRMTVAFDVVQDTR